MSGNPLLGVTRDGDKGLKVIETERGPMAPCSGLILERPGEGRCEEWTLLADNLPVSFCVSIVAQALKYSSGDMRSLMASPVSKDCGATKLISRV